MHAAIGSVFRPLPVFALAAVLTACAPAPIYKTSPALVNATPGQVATSPNNFSQAQVIWGGEVIALRNLSNSTRLEVLAYPLDSSQRPRLKEPATGRFIAEVPGFLEPMDFPKGSLVTLLGQVNGAQDELVGQASYTYPMVSVQTGDLHRWTAEEMRKGHSNIRFGVGVGVGIR